MKKVVSKLFLDLVPVAIGVYIGLLASDWNDEKKTKQLTDKTLHRIELEIKANQAKIDAVDDYHIMILDTLAHMQEPKLNDSIALSFWRGFNIPRLQRAAFDSAVQTGLSREIDLEMLEKLNELYAYQESYADIASTSSQSLYNQDFSDPSNFKRISILIQIIMRDLYYIEEGLKDLIEQNLILLENKSS